MGGRKITLVDWASICQPRENVGLGLPKLQDQNKSLLLKLGLNLITNTGVLWVQVLRSKYGVKETIPKSITKGCCFTLWRAIAKVWPLLKENLSCTVGSGTEIRC